MQRTKSVTSDPMTATHFRIPTSGLAVLIAVAGCSLGCDRGGLKSIASGFNMMSDVRTSLAEDGTVAAAETTRILTGDGSSSANIDLAPLDLKFSTATTGRSLRIRSGGEVVFVADHPGAAPCASFARGAYRLTTGGGTLTTYEEDCPEISSGPLVRADIGLSPNGTVAFSSIRNGAGAIMRGPSTGPLSVYHSGSGTFFNTLALDVSDAGRVAAHFEYFDGFAGGLMRGILVFDQPEQPKDQMLTAIEKLGIGTQTPLAINASGAVAFSLNSALALPIGGTTYNIAPGVYVATPTLFNTPKSLALVADLTGNYCRFGAVDINDAGQVAFEAAIDGAMGCTSGTAWDGIFTGANPSSNAVVVRGQERLDGHQYFDSIYLGEINNAGQVSFMTTYSEPLVDPYKVWRWDP